MPQDQAADPDHKLRRWIHQNTQQMESQINNHIGCVFKTVAIQRIVAFIHTIWIDIKLLPDGTDIKFTGQAFEDAVLTTAIPRTQIEEIDQAALQERITDNTTGTDARRVLGHSANPELVPTRTRTVSELKGQNSVLMHVEQSRQQSTAVLSNILEKDLGASTLQNQNLAKRFSYLPSIIMISTLVLLKSH
ncbi:hypothetical protein H4Q26_016580 [Puccinia striiformis f. sp. tritici PST-130]|nr:hypothetical protein H4Q26_016580 [Puccinia striiformis f. sp. tritici PST-130]